MRRKSRQSEGDLVPMHRLANEIRKILREHDRTDVTVEIVRGPLKPHDWGIQIRSRDEDAEDYHEQLMAEAHVRLTGRKLEFEDGGELSEDEPNH